MLLWNRVPLQDLRSRRETGKITSLWCNIVVVFFFRERFKIAFEIGSCEFEKRTQGDSLSEKVKYSHILQGNCEVLMN